MISVRSDKQSVAFVLLFGFHVSLFVNPLKETVNSCILALEKFAHQAGLVSKTSTDG
jgi:hypothetical protein